MGKIHPPQPVKLFIGVLSSLPELMPQVEQRLCARLGPVDLRSQAYPFDFTHYYDKKMGSPIQRCFLGFARLIEPSEIAEIKVATNNIEAELASEQSQVMRPANLDPGYLEQSKIVLASTKNYYHRLYLSLGIYAEVTLHFEGGGWKTFPWTFPDFQSGRYHSFFTELRNVYRSQLRWEERGGASGE